MREIQTIYGQLQCVLGIDVKPAPDEWDRPFGVDLLIEVNGRYIGIRIAHLSSKQKLENADTWAEFMETSYCKFRKKFGGLIFIVFYVVVGKKKVIYNLEIVEEIKKRKRKAKAACLLKISTPNPAPASGSPAKKVWRFCARAIFWKWVQPLKRFATAKILIPG
jgi:hypothetical protein